MSVPTIFSGDKGQGREKVTVRLGSILGNFSEKRMIFEKDFFLVLIPRKK